MNLTPRITDHEVADLPLARGRVELFEEIVRTPASASDVRGPRRTPPGWAMVVAAAAAALAVATAPSWLGGSTVGTEVDDARGTASAPAPRASSAGHRAVLTAPGWQVTYVVEDGGEGEIRFERGNQSVDIHWRPARWYDDFYRDREAIGPASPVDLLGEQATLWAYAAHDHTVIGPVTGGHFLEVRGSGMDRDAFTALLGSLERVDDEGFAAVVADEAVTPTEIPAEIAAILRDVPVPTGFDRASIDVGGFNYRYQIIAAATGAVTCARIDEYAAGNRAEATEALAGSREWAALREIVDEGDWAEIGVWSVADEMAAGAPVDRLRAASGCPSPGVPTPSG
jgi:hypothetical protein